MPFDQNERHRKDLGDFQSLAASIASVGLLHPIVRPDGELIAGMRRPAADFISWPAATTIGHRGGRRSARRARLARSHRGRLRFGRLVHAPGVQDLVIRPHVVNFRCERWQTPDGDTMTAPLPAGISGHFGPDLRRFVLAQYHQGQVTVARLLALVRAFGIIISKRQLMRLLIAGQDGFLDEARDVPWITVDDTGARHKATNGFCSADRQ